ncbi:hypothetical protein AAZV13_14G091750 [Glycine max]
MCLHVLDMDLAFLPVYFERKKGFFLAYKPRFVSEMEFSIVAGVLYVFLHCFGFALFLCLRFRDFHFFKIIFCHFCVLLTNKEPCMYHISYFNYKFMSLLKLFIFHMGYIFIPAF